MNPTTRTVRTSLGAKLIVHLAVQTSDMNIDDVVELSPTRPALKRGPQPRLSRSAVTPEPGAPVSAACSELGFYSFPVASRLAFIIPVDHIKAVQS
jgi:hypothetical protein